jgi:hypothetical protein
MFITPAVTSVLGAGETAVRNHLDPIGSATELAAGAIDATLNYQDTLAGLQKYASKVVSNREELAKFLSAQAPLLFLPGPGPAGQATRTRVLANIIESQTARQASRIEMQLAMQAQLSSGYSVDSFAMQTLRKGSLVYAGSPGVGAWYTDFATLARSKLSGLSFFNSIQVRPHPVKGPRPDVQAFRVLDDIKVPGGKALNNVAAGAGGGTQFYIPSWKKVLRPIRKFPLH